MSLVDAIIFSGGKAAGGGESEIKSIEIPFSGTIEISGLLRHSLTQTLTPGATINFIKGSGNFEIGGTYQVVLICDNNNLTFNSDFESGTSNISGANGRIWLIFAVNPDLKLGVVRYDATGAALPQLTAPVLTSIDITSDTELTANWTDANTSPNEASSTLQTDTVNTFDSGNLLEITGIAADSTSQLQGSLTQSTLYYQRVKAIGDGMNESDSPWSNILSATTAADSPTLSMVFESNNKNAVITFPEGVYNSVGAGVELTDLNLAFLQNTGTQTVINATTLTQIDGISAPVGGEAQLQLIFSRAVNFATIAVPDGQETLEVSPATNTSIKNILDEYLQTVDTTGEVNLNARYVGKKVSWSNVTNAVVTGDSITTNAVDGGANDTDTILAGSEGFALFAPDSGMSCIISNGNNYEAWDNATLRYSMMELSDGDVWIYESGTLAYSEIDVVTKRNCLLRIAKELQGDSTYDIVYYIDPDGLSGFTEFYRTDNITDEDLYVKCSNTGAATNTTIFQAYKNN